MSIQTAINNVAGESITTVFQTAPERLRDLLSRAEVAYSDFDFEVNGSSASLDDTVSPGAQITRMPRVATAASSDGQVVVEFAKLGNQTSTRNVPTGTTIRAAVAELGWSVSGMTVYLNSAAATLDTVLDGDQARVSFAPNIKGGC